MEETMADRNVVAASTNIDSLNWFSNVVRMNRPCMLPEFAKSWTLELPDSQKVFVFRNEVKGFLQENYSFKTSKVD
jgi:hypothetical protein